MQQQQHVVIKTVSARIRHSGFYYYSSLVSHSPPVPTQLDDRDHEVLSYLIKACKGSLDIKTARETHTRVIRFGYATDPSLSASIVSAYFHCHCLHLAHRVLRQIYSWTQDLVSLNLVVKVVMESGDFVVARKLFDEMPVRDVVTWNSIIGGYVKNARYEEALGVFRGMVGSGVEPDKFTFASVLTGCARLGAIDHGRWVHGLLVEKGVELNSILSAALIDMYAKCGRIETAKEIFNMVEHRESSVWNSMINGLAVHGLGVDALTLFSKMELERVLPDSITFLGILTACSHCGFVNEGRQYFELMRSQFLVQPEIEHYGAMVDLLGRAGQLEQAYSLIQEMPMKPDLIIWRALLSACKTYKRPDLGEVAIANMRQLRSGDYVLLSNIFCSHSKWDNAEGVRETMRKNGVRKVRGKSWFERGGVLHHFKAGDKSHPEIGAIYKTLNRLIQRTKAEGFVPATDLVMMDISEEEKEGNLFLHSEKLAVAYGILKTSPGMELRVSKNLRICYDCHNWIKMVASMLSRVIIVRDRIRFHRFEGGLCSCGDYW